MRSDTFSHIAALHLILLVCAACAGQDTDAHQAVLDRIFADWQERREAMDAVEYRLEGTELVPRGQYTPYAILFGSLPSDTTEQLPAEDRLFRRDRRHVFDFSRNRIRTELWREEFQIEQLIDFTTYTIHLYDGENVQSLSPREENTSPEWTPPDYEPEFEYNAPGQLVFALSFDMEPLFLAHGRPVTFAQRKEQYDRFTLPIQRDIFRWHADASIDGRDVTVLRTINMPDNSEEVYLEYWVDLERDSAVLRCVEYANGNLDQIDINYQETEYGWLPAGYRRSGTSGDGELYLQFEFTVSQIIADPPLSDDLFHAEPARGMVVKDHATGEEYVYGGSGEPNVDAREHYIQTLRESQEPHSSRWVAIGLVAAVLVVGVGIVLRRWQSRS